MTGMPAWVKKGAKCVCIRNPIDGPLFAMALAPRAGDICTVAASKMVRGRPGLQFEELPHDADLLNHWYDALGFRPLITRSQEQDVEMFKTITDGMTLTERLDRIKEALDA